MKRFKKYLVFILLAGLIFSCEKDNSLEITEEQKVKIEFEKIRKTLANNMVDFVTESKPILEELKRKKKAKGFTNELPPFDEYLVELPNGKYLSEIGVNIAKASYSLLKSNTSDSEIISSYNAKELFVLVKEIEQGKTFDEAMLSSDTPNHIKAKSSQSKGFWGELWSGIKDAWNWVWENRTEIIGVLASLKALGLLIT